MNIHILQSQSAPRLLVNLGLKPRIPFATARKMSLLSPFNQRGAMANRPVDFGAMSPRFWFNDSHPFLDLFNDRLSKFNQLSSSSANGNIGCWAPYFDVKETKDAYKLEGELPGLEQKDISIEFADNNTLTIRGHIENVHEEGNRTNNANSDDAPDTSTNMKDDKNGATEGRS